jgi:hypothetical protein
MAKSGSGSDPAAARPGSEKRMTATCALDPYDLDSASRVPTTDLISDLVRLIEAAEYHGLRPARAARWRGQLLTITYPPDVLTRCERRLRGWLLRRVEQTATWPRR